MDIGRIAKGWSTGGLSEVGSAMGMDKRGRQELEALETPEQRAARAMLLRFAETGQFGEFKAGAEVPLGYGDFNATDMEQQGLSQLESMLRSSIPDQYRLSDDAIRDFMDTSEAGIDRSFQPFNALTERAMRESETALKRGAGFAGNLYSTDTIRKMGDVQARGNESKMAELARLTEGAMNRKLSAIPLALESTGAKESAALNRVVASQELGSLTRRLNDQRIKTRDAELLRRRQELLLPIDAAGTVLGSAPQFGVKGINTPSPYQELLGMVAQIGGVALGSYAGGYGASKGAAAGAKPPSYGGGGSVYRGHV